MAESYQNPITGIVEAFLRAQTLEECKRIVETQRDALLTDAADRFLALMIQLPEEKGDADLARYIKDRRDLLAHCRRDGIEVAFAERQKAKALEILEWATSQYVLATNLARNRQGDRARVDHPWLAHLLPLSGRYLATPLCLQTCCEPNSAPCKRKKPTIGTRWPTNILH